MPATRVQYPPVYTAIRLRRLASSLGCLGEPRASRAIEAALATLQAAYPGRSIMLTDAGTSALTLALGRDDLPRRDGGAGRAPVALPAYCCPDLASAAIGAGRSILLYDSDPRTLEPDLKSLAHCLEGGARQVVVAHLYGRLVDVEAVSRLASPYGASVIEDAAQHAGARRQGRRGGSHASVSVLSFGRGKGLNAGGGGALLVSSPAEDWAPSLDKPTRGVALRQWLTVCATELLSHPVLYAIPAGIPALAVGATSYHPPTPPRAMSALTARLLCDALGGEPEVLAARRAHAIAYGTHLLEGPVSLFAPPKALEEDGALRFPLRLPKRPDASLERLGVMRSYPRTLYDYPQVRPHLHPACRPAPGAQELASSTYTLPTHSRITTALRQQIIDQLLRSA